jgi:hypothetical protein
MSLFVDSTQLLVLEKYHQTVGRRWANNVSDDFAKAWVPIKNQSHCNHSNCL